MSYTKASVILLKAGESIGDAGCPVPGQALPTYEVDNGLFVCNWFQTFFKFTFVGQCSGGDLGVSFDGEVGAYTDLDAAVPGPYGFVAGDMALWFGKLWVATGSCTVTKGVGGDYTWAAEGCLLVMLDRDSGFFKLRIDGTKFTVAVDCLLTRVM